MRVKNFKEFIHSQQALIHSLRSPRLRERKARTPQLCTHIVEQNLYIFDEIDDGDQMGLSGMKAVHRLCDQIKSLIDELDIIRLREEKVGYCKSNLDIVSAI